MGRLNYTVITVSTKEVKHIQNNVCFDNRTSAERYAEGLTIGAAMAGKRWGVMMLLNGEYDHHTAISKNMDNAKRQAYFKGYEWRKEAI